MRKEDKNTTVQIASRIGTSTVILVALNLIFARNYAWVSIFMVLFMVIFGIVLVILENKKRNRK